MFRRIAFGLILALTGVVQAQSDVVTNQADAKRIVVSSNNEKQVEALVRQVTDTYSNYILNGNLISKPKTEIGKLPSSYCSLDIAEDFKRTYRGRYSDEEAIKGAGTSVWLVMPKFEIIGRQNLEYVVKSSQVTKTGGRVDLTLDLRPRHAGWQYMVVKCTKIGTEIRWSEVARLLRGQFRFFTETQYQTTLNAKPITNETLTASIEQCGNQRVADVAKQAASMKDNGVDMNRLPWGNWLNEIFAPNRKECREAIFRALCISKSYEGNDPVSALNKEFPGLNASIAKYFNSFTWEDNKGQSVSEASDQQLKDKILNELTKSNCFLMNLQASKRAQRPINPTNSFEVLKMPTDASRS